MLQVLLDSKERLDRRGQLERLGQQGQLGVRVQMEPLDQQEHQDLRELAEPPVQEEHQGPVELQGFQDLVVQLEVQVILEQRVRLESVDPEALQEHPDHQDLVGLPEW